MKKFILSVCIVMVFFSCKNDTTKPTFKVKDIVGNWQSNDDKDSKFIITNSGNLEIEGISIPIDVGIHLRKLKSIALLLL